MSTETVELIATGRELDTTIAEKVMRWQRQPDYNYWMSFPGETFKLHALIANWKPSTDITFAMQIVEKLRERFSAISVTWPSWDRGAFHECRISNAGGVIVCAHGDTVPEAICRAALKSVELGKETKR